MGNKSATADLISARIFGNESYDNACWRTILTKKAFQAIEANGVTHFPG